jgi:SAM-dependent methyltransferase
MTTSTQRFTNRVANYVKYRPGYPEEVLNFLKEKAGITAGSVIADAGSGTGIFTKLLLDEGYTVYAIEPNDAMRKSSVEQLHNYKNFHAVNGTAEDTTLESHGIDLVVCAQAFHWFDQTLAKTEFKRILKPKGQVALIWNNRQIEYDEFAIAYELLLQQQGTDYSEVNHRNITDVDFSNFFKNGKYELAKYNNVQIFDEDGLIGRAFSSSYIPPKETEPGQAFLADLKALFQQYQTNKGTVDFVYQTEVYLGKV